jgi:hypothetical protein
MSVRIAILRGGLVASFVACAGCDSRTLGPPPTDAPDGGPAIVADGLPPLARKIDLLFMVDNSSSMSASQEDLRRGFSRFMEVFKNLPGGVPDVHMAVISSDMGVGHDEVAGCNATGGDNGEFQHGVARGALDCTSTGLIPGATYISSTGGENPQNNFSGDIGDVFRCIAPIGQTGCGFENPLRSVARALGADGQPPPSANRGFLRPDAYLGIVLITNEDDCSAASPSFYDIQNNSNLAARLGPPGNFRCAEFGYLCDGARPGRQAPNGLVTDVVSYGTCVPAESGELVPVSSFVRMIKSLKPDPRQIFVASIQGMPEPFEVRWRSAPFVGDPPWPEIGHSCIGGNGSYADPGIRLQSFVAAFGANGLVFPICNDDFGPALHQIASTMTRYL